MDGIGAGGSQPGAAALAAACAAALAASAFSCGVRLTMVAFIAASASLAPSPSAETIDLVALAQAEAKQRDEAARVGRLVAAADAQCGAGAAGGVDPTGGRTGVEPAGIIADPLETFGEVDRRRGDRDARQRRVGQRGDDRARVGGANQAVESRLVLQQAGEAAQDVEVGVGLGGDGDDQANCLAFVPRHAVRDLQDGQPDLTHHGAVFDHAVGDGDAVAEKGVGRRLAPHHRFDVGGIDPPGGDEHLSGFADRRLLVGGAGAEAHQVGGKDL